MAAQSTFNGSTFLNGAGFVELGAEDAGAEDEAVADPAALLPLAGAPLAPEPGAPLDTVTTAVTVRRSPAVSDPHPDIRSTAAATAAPTIR
jgi:hypothetical protein